MYRALLEDYITMDKKNKRMEAVNIKVDSNMDADDYGQRIAECIQQLNPDLNVVNLVKVDFGESRIPVDELAHFLENLRDMFISVDARNCVFVPIGGCCGVKDITIDYVIVTDDANNGTKKTAD